MSIKKLDNRFDTALWIIFLALGIASWFLAKSISAPKFEYVDNPIVKTYTFNTADGDVVESEYEAVWRHDAFSSPRIVLYDRRYGKTYDIKDEYLLEYESMMPETHYGAFFYRWFWVLFPLFVILSGVIVYAGGGALRDKILTAKIKRDPDFSSVAYFLYTDRVCCRDEVKSLIPATIDNYIKNKIPLIAQKYPSSFTTLIIQLLTTIKYYEDTKIEFFVSYLENSKDQLDFLKELSAYWTSRIGKNPNAEPIRDHVDSCRQKKYVKIETKITLEKVSEIITRQLNSIFTEIMEGEIFSFKANESSAADRYKLNGKLFVAVVTSNSLKTFSWSGDEYNGTDFPGLYIKVTIYHYVNSEKKILWEKVLDPKTTYKAESLVVSDFYDNMIEQTLKTFEDSLKK